MTEQVLRPLRRTGGAASRAEEMTEDRRLRFASRFLVTLPTWGKHVF